MAGSLSLCQQRLWSQWHNVGRCMSDNPSALTHYDERPPQGGDCHVLFDKGWGLKLADRQRVFEVVW